jgi:hypothetical protein
MSDYNKFVLTDKHKREGLILTIVWAGGTSLVKTGKTTTYKNRYGKEVTDFECKKVQKLTQSIHKISPLVIKNFISTPVSKWDKNWNKKSETIRVFLHLQDFVHDRGKDGQLKSWYI